MVSGFTTVVLAFNDLVTRNRVLRTVWVRYRHIAVVANRDLRALWQRRLAVVVLVGIFNCLDYFFLFTVRQLGWVIDLHLVAWCIWFVLACVLAFDNLVTRNRVLRTIWVGYRYVTVVTNRDLRALWQRRLAVLVLVGIFDRLDYLILFTVG